MRMDALPRPSRLAFVPAITVCWLAIVPGRSGAG